MSINENENEKEIGQQTNLLVFDATKDNVVKGASSIETEELNKNTKCNYYSDVIIAKKDLINKKFFVNGIKFINTKFGVKPLIAISASALTEEIGCFWGSETLSNNIRKLGGMFFEKNICVLKYLEGSGDRHYFLLEKIQE